MCGIFIGLVFINCPPKFLLNMNTVSAILFYMSTSRIACIEPRRAEIFFIVFFLARGESGLTKKAARKWSRWSLNRVADGSMR